MSKILYTERREHWETGPTSRFVTHYVEVEVRFWTREGMTPDVVIESRVLVDRELVVDRREAFAHNRANAAFIRLGIQRFDALVAAHPYFGHDWSEQADDGEEG